MYSFFLFIVTTIISSFSYYYHYNLLFIKQNKKVRRKLYYGTVPVKTSNMGNMKYDLRMSFIAGMFTHTMDLL